MKIQFSGLHVPPRLQNTQPALRNYLVFFKQASVLHRHILRALFNARQEYQKAPSFPKFPCGIIISQVRCLVCRMWHRVTDGETDGRTDRYS